MEYEYDNRKQITTATTILSENTDANLDKNKSKQRPSSSKKINENDLAIIGKAGFQFSNESVQVEKHSESTNTNISAFSKFRTTENTILPKTSKPIFPVLQTSFK